MIDSRSVGDEAAVSAPGTNGRFPALMIGRDSFQFLSILVAILVSGCDARAPQSASPDGTIASRDQSPPPKSCSGSERTEHVLAMLDRFSMHWDELGGRSDVRCEITLSLNRKGEVLATKFQECLDDVDLREQMLSAIKRAQPFPEPSNPSCFSDTFDISVGPPKDSD